MFVSNFPHWKRDKEVKSYFSDLTFIIWLRAHVSLVFKVTSPFDKSILHIQLVKDVLILLSVC